MLVTALSPVIGYDKASAIAHKAHDEGRASKRPRWRRAIDEQGFDDVVDPRKMVGVTQWTALCKRDSPPISDISKSTMAEVRRR